MATKNGKNGKNGSSNGNGAVKASAHDGTFSPADLNGRLGDVMNAISFGASKSGYALGIRCGSKPSKSPTGNPTIQYASVRVNAQCTTWREAVAALATLTTDEGTPQPLTWSIPAHKSEDMTFKLTRIMSAPRVHCLFAAYFKLPYSTALSVESITEHVAALFPDLSKADLAALCPAPKPAPKPRADRVPPTVQIPAQPPVPVVS